MVDSKRFDLRGLVDPCARELAYELLHALQESVSDEFPAKNWPRGQSSGTHELPSSCVPLGHAVHPVDEPLMQLKHVGSHHWQID
eukprot:7095636-Prymnesium_polylepis.1